MSALTLILTLVLGILAGAAALWPFRRRAIRGAAPGPWPEDASLVDGHRPPDLQALASQFLGVVRQATGSQGVALLRKTEGGWRAVACSPGVPFTTPAPVPPKMGLVGLAGEGRKEFLADSVHAESLGYLAPQPAPLSLALMPLHHRDETKGILACHRAQGSPYQDAEVAILKRSATVLMGWEALAAHVRKMSASRVQEERVAAGMKRMLEQSDPQEICGLLLDTVFDLLPAHYGFVVVAHSVAQYYCIVCKKFAAPESFHLGRDTWTHWVLHRASEPLYLDGTANRESAMPILFPKEPFPEDPVALLVPLVFHGNRMGVLGVVGRAGYPFEEEDRSHVEALLGPALALLDLSLLHDSQRTRAIKDPLTGVFNRRHFDETLQVELKRATRQGSSCGLILLDLDHFKSVNDTHGHQAGDNALRAVTQRIQQSISDIDIPCRYGGEEFAVILPDSTLQEAAKVAERIRYNLAETECPVLEDRSVALTASLGVSSFPSPAQTLAGLLRSVDTALYQAKQKGRNRICLAGKG